MNRHLVDAALDLDGTLVALSTRVPGDGESHRSGNQLHRFDGSGWSLVQDWTGWEATGIAPGQGFLVCASVRALHIVRSGRIERIEHPEPERSLNCCFRTADVVYVGGSTGYYLLVDAETASLEARNLAQLGVPKPGRDILGFGTHGDGLVLCGSSRLLVGLVSETAAALVPVGPTAATPHLHDVAVVDGAVYAASWDRLWRIESGDLQPQALPLESAEISALAAWERGLLIGGQSIVSFSDGQLATPLYRHESPDAWVCRFLLPPDRVPLALFSDGTLLKLGDPPTDLPRVPLSGGGA